MSWCSRNTAEIVVVWENYGKLTHILFPIPQFSPSYAYQLSYRSGVPPLNPHVDWWNSQFPSKHTLHQSEWVILLILNNSKQQYSQYYFQVNWMISFPLILNNSKHSLQKTGFFFGICTYQWGPWWLLFFPLGMVPSDLAMVSGGIFHHGLLLKNPITMWVCHGKIHHF